MFLIAYMNYKSEELVPICFSSMHKDRGMLLAKKQENTETKQKQKTNRKTKQNKTKIPGAFYRKLANARK